MILLLWRTLQVKEATIYGVARPHLTVSARKTPTMSLVLRGNTYTTMVSHAATDFTTGVLRAQATAGLSIAARRDTFAVAESLAAAALTIPETLATRSDALTSRSVSTLSVSLYDRTSLGSAELRAAVMDDWMSIAERLATASLTGYSSGESVGDKELTAQAPFTKLVSLHLGTVYRGDTIIMPPWQAVDGVGNVLDLTSSTLWFTAKMDLFDTDVEQPTIQTSTDEGGIVILDATGGLYQVTLHPDKTQNLTDDVVFTFDVQVEQGIGYIRTIRFGTLIVVRDVTRAVA